MHGECSTSLTCLAWAANGLTAAREPRRGALRTDTLRLLLSRDALEIAWAAMMLNSRCMF